MSISYSHFVIYFAKADHLYSLISLVPQIDLSILNKTPNRAALFSSEPKQTGSLSKCFPIAANSIKALLLLDWSCGRHTDMNQQM